MFMWGSQLITNKQIIKTMYSCNNTEYLVAAHFVEATHPISSLKYTGIEHVALPRRGGNMEIILLQREVYWISYLKH
jgi:glutathionylspermidine synthase